MRSLSTGVVAWRKLLWLPLAMVTLLMSWAVQATEPVQIGFTLEGCRLETGATYDQSDFTCSDEGYVTGNLGKQWNELDYVPHRITLKNGGGSQTFDFIVAGDYTPNSNSTTGWDDITALTLNTDLSDGSCNAVVSGPVSITPGGSGAGGAYETIYRAIEATMVPGETCVYDYAQRLSLGASEFSGSSLQSNLWNEFLASSGIGQKRIQLPVADILPQELNKDMNAQQDTVYIWNLTKTAVPSYLSFQNSCERDDPMTETTTIRIEWQRLPGDPGKVTVVTNIYAYNPAHLDVHVSVNDMIYGDLGGGEVLLGTASADDVLVPAGATVKLLTHSIPDVDEGVFGLNDVAHATYKIGTIEVPGQTDAFASAEVQPSGNEVDATAVISDLEGPITGAGYMFSVDAVNGSGDFTDGYSLGEMTAGPVAWSSTEQSADGFVEFVKTIYLDEPRDSSGALPDIATLLASDNFEISKNASVTFADYPLVELTIHKTIDLDLDDGENASFYFDVYRVDTVDEKVAENVEISFGPGETDKSVVIGNLDPNETYRVVEVSGSDGFMLDDEQQASILLPICGGDVYFANEAEPASAKAIKVTVPAGHDPSGFEFLLTGPGLGGGVPAVSDGDGNAVFSVELFEEGEYTITEQPREGWELTDVSGGESNSVADANCTFIVNLPESANYEFQCTFENTKLATIIVTKVIEGNNALNLSGDFDFNSGVGSFDAMLDAQTWSFAADALSGAQVSHEFTNLSPGSYDVTEADPFLDLFSLTDITCIDPTSNSSTGGFTANIDLAAGETVECIFTNTKLAAPGNLIIYKTTIGDVGTFDYVSSDGTLPPFSLTTLSENTPTTSPLATFNNLEPGIYKANELVPAGWDLTGLSCNDAVSIDGSQTEVNLATAEVSVSIDDGETVECFYENTKRGYIIVDKVTDPAGDPQLFDFTPSYTAPFALADASTPHMSDPLVNGTYSVGESVPAGWDLTSATCDDGSAPSSIDLAPGETVTCTFENTKRGMAEVLKTVSGIAPNGVYPAFDFQIRDGSGVVASATSDVITGFAYFSCEAGVSPDICVDVAGMAKLVPGAYEFCELDVQTGWTLTGSSNDGPLSWYSLIIGEDYIGECATFTLSVAETEQFNVDNTPPPGGMAHTIGFWKNWTSCDGKGNQYEHWLTDPEYFNILDEFLPIYLHPELEITQCAVGVDILDKRDYEDSAIVGDGRKKASDAAYGLAAQLMAVQLNIAADAGTCPALMDAKLAAEQLLASIDFTGTGDYLKKPKGPSKTLAQEAKTLAGILDSYNNNMLCP